jgi:hypothetical protein
MTRYPYTTLYVLAVLLASEDVRHPGENPGYLALDPFAAASLGAGGAARVGAAGRAACSAKGARRVTQALARKPSEGGSLLRRPALGREEIAPGVYVIEVLDRTLARAMQQEACDRSFKQRSDMETARRSRGARR